MKTTPIHLLLLASLASGPAWAGNYMLSRGDTKLGNNLSYSSSNSYWDQNRKLRDASCRSGNWTLEEGVEHGLSYYHTVFAKAELKSSECGASAVSGLGDLTVGVRGRWDVFTNGRTWEAALIIPTGYSSAPGRRLGYGEMGAQLGAGIKFEGPELGLGIPYELNAEGAFRFWAGSPSSQFLASLRLNRQLARSDSVYAFWSGDFALGDGRPEPSTYANQSILADYDKMTVGLGWSHSLAPHSHINLRFGKAIWGRNAGNDFSIGLNYSYTWTR